jgi:GTP-binding protein HflX
VGEGRLVEVLNKIDLLDAATRGRITNGSRRRDDESAISAATGAGIKALLAMIDARLQAGRELVEIELDPSDGSGLAWLYRNGEVVSREEVGGRLRLKVGLDAADLGRWRHRGADVTLSRP